MLLERRMKVEERSGGREHELVDDEATRDGVATYSISAHIDPRRPWSSEGRARCVLVGGDRKGLARRRSEVHEPPTAVVGSVNVEADVAACLPNSRKEHCSSAGFHALPSVTDGIARKTIQDQPLHLALASLLWQEDLRQPIKLLGVHPGFVTNRVGVGR